MQKLILFFFLFFPQLLFSQMENVKLLKKTCDFEESYALLDKIEDLKVIESNEYLYTKLGLESQLNTSEAFLTLSNLLKKDTSVKVFNIPDVLPLIDSPKFDSLASMRIDHLVLSGKEYKYPDVTIELWKMKIRDQAYYNELSNCSCNLSSRKAFAYIKNELNLKNQKLLDSIYYKIGWPTISKVRKSASSSALLVVIHADLEYQKKYIKELEQLALEGQIEKSDFAVLFDKMMMKEKGVQLYGTQVMLTEELKFDYSTLKDRKNIDSLRVSMGLPSLDFYLKILNVKK